MSSTAQHSLTQQDEGDVLGAEHPSESDELSRNVLGLINAYGMGTRLDPAKLFPARPDQGSDGLGSLV